MAVDLQAPASSTPSLSTMTSPTQEKISEKQAFHYQRDRDHIAGCIGTGLFFGLGEILALCGPLGALLVYLHVCTVVYSTIMSIGEMTAFAPISGSIVHFVARWLDPAAGFAVCLEFSYAAIAVPLEITALTAFVSFWDTNPSHTGIYVGATVVGLFIINFFGVRSIIGGLVISLGGGPDHDRFASTYWEDPGPMVSTLEPGATGRFLGMLVAVVPAAYSVSGFELIAISAAESKQPRTNIIRAMKFVVFRLVLFYVMIPTIVLNDPSQSPFVLAFERAGVKVLPSIINAIIISSAYSSANTCLFTASRILYAPKVFTTCTKGGIPWVAVIVAGLFSLLAFMTVSSSASTVFKYSDLLTSPLATMCGLIGWTVINTTYLRYYYGLKIQGIIPQGIYRSPLQPYAAMWAIFWSVFYILISGISVFWDFSASSFVASYINLPIILSLFVGYKLWFKTKMQPLSELDFISHIPTLEETADEGLLVEKLPLLQKIGIVLKHILSVMTRPQ
ncbi:general amino acid permease [Pisolithus tinctorius]|nr:general amino acid permease [Pisolithus tinctorius]